MARRVRSQRAFRSDPRYAAHPVEASDLRATIVGILFLGIGFAIGRRGRRPSPEIDVLRAEIVTMRAEGQALRDRATRIERDSADARRGLYTLINLLPVGIREALARDARASDPGDRCDGS
jgi:hypothetical protein